MEDASASKHAQADIQVENIMPRAAHTTQADLIGGPKGSCPPPELDPQHVLREAMWCL